MTDPCQLRPVRPVLTVADIEAEALDCWRDAMAFERRIPSEPALAGYLRNMAVARWYQASGAMLALSRFGDDEARDAARLLCGIALSHVLDNL